MLFAGGRDRSAATFCEVELLFDNEDGSGPLDFSELSIARRLHRGGEGEYVVNKARVRRTDLVEMLADVGLGAELHSVIGQGRVERLQKLLEADPKVVVATDQGGRTPLHAAAAGGHVKTVALLLEKKAPPDARDRDGSAPLQLAVAGGHLQVVEMLAAGANPSARTARDSRPPIWPSEVVTER